MDKLLELLIDNAIDESSKSIIGKCTHKEFARECMANLLINLDKIAGSFGIKGKIDEEINIKLDDKVLLNLKEANIRLIEENSDLKKRLSKYEQVL